MSIYTPILKPVFNSLEERERFINCLENKFPNIGKWVDYIAKSHATLLENARWYIFKNWEKVKDWSDYLITIDGTDNTNRRLYDFHDSDISISINHEENWKILNEDEVLELAIYIEQNLNEQK